MSDSAANHEHHAIDYVELTVVDIADAKRFYRDAFSWTFTDYGPEYCGINNPSAGGTREVGGMRQSAEVRVGGPLVVLYSKDLEASLEAVRAAGGEISAAPFSFPGGRRFHFTDPSGNELAVWSLL